MTIYPVKCECGAKVWRLEEQCFANLDTEANTLDFEGLSEMEAFCVKCGAEADEDQLAVIEAVYHALTQKADIPQK